MKTMMNIIKKIGMVIWYVGMFLSYEVVTACVGCAGISLLYKNTNLYFTNTEGFAMLGCAIPVSIWITMRITRGLKNQFQLMRAINKKSEIWTI